MLDWKHYLQFVGRVTSNAGFHWIAGANGDAEPRNVCMDSAMASSPGCPKSDDHGEYPGNDRISHLKEKENNLQKCLGRRCSLISSQEALHKSSTLLTRQGCIRGTCASRRWLDFLHLKKGHIRLGALNVDKKWIDWIDQLSISNQIHFKIPASIQIPKSIAIWPNRRWEDCGSRPPARHGVPRLYCYTHCPCCCPCSGHNCRDIFGLLGLQERWNAGCTSPCSPCRSDGDTTEDCICGTSSSSWPKLLSFISCVPTITSASLHSDRTCPATTLHNGPAESCLYPADFAKWSNLSPVYRSWFHFASVSLIQRMMFDKLAESGRESSGLKWRLQWKPLKDT